MWHTSGAVVEYNNYCWSMEPMLLLQIMSVIIITILIIITLDEINYRKGKNLQMWHMRSLLVS